MATSWQNKRFKKKKRCLRKFWPVQVAYPLIIHCTFLILVSTTSSVAICRVMKAEFYVTLNKLVVAISSRSVYPKCVHLK